MSVTIILIMTSSSTRKTERPFGIRADISEFTEKFSRALPLGIMMILADTVRPTHGLTSNALSLLLSVALATQFQVSRSDILCRRVGADY